MCISISVECVNVRLSITGIDRRLKTFTHAYFETPINSKKVSLP